MSDLFAQESIDELIEELLEQNPDIAKQARAAGLRIGDLKKRALRSISELPESPSFDEDPFLANLYDVREMIQANLGDLPSAPQVFWDALSSNARRIILFSVGLAVAYRQYVSTTSGPQSTESTLRLFSSALAIGLLISCIAVVGLYAYRGRSERLQTEEWLGQILTEIWNLSNSRRSMFRDRTLLSTLLSVINDAQAIRYDQSLAGTTFIGLSQTYDASSELSTKDHRRIVETLDQMPGGSVGLAGPRGVGKTTLLRSLCNPARVFASAKRTVAVLVPAPVTYDSRDFLLFLFTELCRAILNDTSSSSTYYPEMSRWRHRAPTRVGDLLPVRLGIRASLLLGASGLGMAVVSLAVTRLGHEWDWIGDPLLSVGVSPERVFWLGLGLLLISLLGFAKERALRHEAFLHYRDRFAGGTITESLDLFDLITAEEELRPLVQSLLHELQFQQTFSFGWSAGLRLPLGVETGRTGGAAIAKRPLSFPDLVHAFRLFVRRLVDTYVVVIGVDELDKLESPQSAQQLLNDLKLLFDIEGCYFLLSVSESALASFDSRGIPVRDVMDSTFDTVLRVDYLSVDESRELLNRRVVGLPVPYMALCHCLSGGLPRDLIRVCRTIAEKGTTGAELVAIARHVLEEDIAARARALIHTVEQAGLTSELLPTIQAVHELQIAREQKEGVARELSRELLVAVRVVDANAKSLIVTDEAVRGLDAAKDIAARCDQFAAYLYHMATLADLFLTSRAEEEWKDVVSEESIGRLARARQMIAASPSSAITMTNEVRVMLRWDIPRMPRGFVKSLLIGP